MLIFVVSLLVLQAVCCAGLEDWWCSTDLDCSFNGACMKGVCFCWNPWGGRRCGVLQYQASQVVSSRNFYPLNATDAPKSGPCVTESHVCDALNTWNGPIAEVYGEFHMFNPLYKKGSLLETQDMMHGVADNIVGPYT